MSDAAKFSVTDCAETDNLFKFWLRKKKGEVFHVLDENKSERMWRLLMPNETLDMFGPENTKEVDGITFVSPRTNVIFREVVSGGGKGECRRLCPKCATYYEMFYDVSRVEYV